MIQGTGEVRAGIWARSVCTKEDLGFGSMLPQIEWAKQKGIPVLIMNPNHSEDSGERVPLSQDMRSHTKHVWRNYIIDSGFERILLIAHSAGGPCVSEIIAEFSDSFFNQVAKIAYTDTRVIDKNLLNEE